MARSRSSTPCLDLAVFDAESLGTVSLDSPVSAAAMDRDVVDPQDEPTRLQRPPTRQGRFSLNESQVSQVSLVQLSPNRMWEDYDFDTMDAFQCMRFHWGTKDISPVYPRFRYRTLWANQTPRLHRWRSSHRWATGGPTSVPPLGQWIIATNVALFLKLYSQTAHKHKQKAINNRHSAFFTHHFDGQILCK